MKQNKTKLLLSILFFGGMWGIVEATVGYLLHFLPILLSGTLMFPFVTYILMKTYRTTNSKISLLWVGVVAAMIKSVNLFLPQFSIFKTINPMISIILEALMVMAVLKVFEKDDLRAKLVAFPLASMAWRALFLVTAGAQYFMNGFLSSYLTSFYPAFEFIVIYGLISGLVIDLVIVAISIRKTKFFKSVRFNITPALSALSIILAVVLTLVIRLYL